MHGAVHLGRDDDLLAPRELRERTAELAPVKDQPFVVFHDAYQYFENRFGLNAVKNVGEAAAEAIVRVRAEGGPFESIWELTERVDPQVLNRKGSLFLTRPNNWNGKGMATRWIDRRENRQPRETEAWT